MVGDWYDASRTTKSAVVLTGITFVLFLTAFFSPYWLQSFSSERLPNPKFKNLGLWEVCMNGFHDMRHQYETRFYGCKHILLEEYIIIWDELIPPFMVATQFFYTLSLIAMLIAILFVSMYLLCIDDYYKISVLKWSGIDLIAAGALGTIALIIFGAKGDGRNYMPEWEHNYLSWSFGIAFLAVIFQYIAGILFIIEGRVQQRWRDSSAEKQYPSGERRV